MAAVPVPSIVAALQATFMAPDDASRKGAEEVLLTGHTRPGFLGSLLSIVGTRDGQASVAGTNEFYTRQQASIVFKRLIEMHWDAVALGPKAVILPDGEKATIRGGLISFIGSEPAVDMVAQLAEAVGIIAKADCPGRWPDLPGLLAAEVSSDDPVRVRNGSIVITSVLERYSAYRESKIDIAKGARSVSALPDGRRFTPRDVMDAVMAVADAPLRAAAARAAAGSPGDNAAGSILHHSLQCFLTAIKTDVTGVCATGESLTGWFGAIDATLSKEVPVAATDCDATLRDQPWWLAKTVAARCVARFVEGHAAAALVAGHRDEMRATATARAGEPASPADVSEASRSRTAAGRFFAERLLARMWDTSSKALMRTGPSPDTYFSNLINVLQGMISPEYAALFAEHVRPRFSALLTEAILPAAILPEAEAELALTDPEQFLREFQKDFVHDSARRRDKATETISCLFRSRADSLGKPFLSWIARQLVAIEGQAPEARNWRAKEAILTCLCFAANEIVDADDLSLIVEPILVRFCAPELAHPHPAMKSRALALFAQFTTPTALRGFSDPSIASKTVSAALHGLADPNQAVQYQAANLIMSASTIPSVRPLLRSNLRAITAKFFEIIAMVNVGGVAECLFRLFSIFSIEVAVDAPALTDMVIAALSRTIAAVDDDESEHADWAASHLVLCLDALVGSPAVTPRMAEVLEAKILPVLGGIFSVGAALNYFDEAARVVNNLVRALRRVTPGLWRLFGPMVKMGTTYCVDFVEDLAPVLDTFVVVDPATFLAVVPGTAMEDGGADVRPLDLMSHIVSVMDRREDSDRAHAAFIMNSVLTCMPGAIDDFVTHLVGHYATALAAPRTAKPGVLNGHCRSALCSAIATAFLYNGPLALAAIPTPEARTAVFTAMADPLVDPSNYASVPLVHKSIMLGLMRVLSLDPAALPADVARLFPAILQTAVGYAHERLVLVRDAAGDEGPDPDAPDTDRDYDAATAEESAEFRSILAGLGVDPSAAAAKAAAGPQPMVLGEATLGEVADIHGFAEDWAEVEDATPEDVDFSTLDSSRVAGDVAVLQVDTLLEFDALMARWQSPGRAAALATLSAGVSEACRGQIAELAAAATEHKAVLARRREAMAAGAGTDGVPTAGEAGDPALHTVLSPEAVHAVASVAEAARGRLAAYMSSVDPARLAAVDAAAAAAGGRTA